MKSVTCFAQGGSHLGHGAHRVQKCRKSKVARMTPSIMENVPTPQEILLKLFPASQLSYRAKIKKIPTNIKTRASPYFLYQTTWQLFSISETRIPVYGHVGAQVPSPILGAHGPGGRGSCAPKSLGSALEALVYGIVLPQAKKRSSQSK